MSFYSILMTALSAVLTHSLSIRLGNYVLTASNNGTPVHFTFATAIAALEEVAAGATTSFQVGSTLITVAKV